MSVDVAIDARGIAGVVLNHPPVNGLYPGPARAPRTADGASRLPRDRASRDGSCGWLARRLPPLGAAESLLLQELASASILPPCPLELHRGVPSASARPDRRGIRSDHGCSKVLGIDLDFRRGSAGSSLSPTSDASPASLGFGLRSPTDSLARRRPGL